MLVSTPSELAARRHACGENVTLQKLKLRLTGFVDQVVDSSIEIPTIKALLSRDGGVCSADGSRLVFDPFRSAEHRCPTCGRTEHGDVHLGAWVWKFHLWFTERILLAGVLGQLGEHQYDAWVRSAIIEYATLYRQYPNRDNVLGPTRPFFSTYLESIWLLQLSTACSSVSWDSQQEEHATVLEMVRESATLIRSFDEAWSNRQVWNNAALIAAGRLLANEEMVDYAVDGAHGIGAQLLKRVDPFGRWHEGENYHLFALRGFQWAAELLQPVGVDLYSGATGERLREMHVAPWKTLLPDFTLPARGDSPYGVSVRQPRFAEMWEIGWARTQDHRLLSILHSLYETEDGDVEDFGPVEISEVETNRAPCVLSRHLLGWKALMWMTVDLPEANAENPVPKNVLVGDSGPVVLNGGIRRNIMLECRGTGLGHGHPDQLHLSLFWSVPGLVDLGSGSYVNESLHWYRSTLAHNAPGVAGVGQFRGETWCAGLAEEGGWTWCKVSGRDLLGPGSMVHRVLVSGPDYLIDVVTIDVPDNVTVDLPIHLLNISVPKTALKTFSGSWRAAPGAGHETGYDSASVLGEALPENQVWSAPNTKGDLTVVCATRENEQILVAQGLGPPTITMADGAAHTFLVRRATGPGKWLQVYSLAPETVRHVSLDENGIVIEGKTKSESVKLVENGAHVHSNNGEMFLSDVRDPPVRKDVVRRPRTVRTIQCAVLSENWDPRSLVESEPWDAIRPLGEAAYRRSETPYPGEDHFSAKVFLGTTGSEIVMAVSVVKPSLVVFDDIEENETLDNESPDIHSDGIQCYVNCGEWRGYVAIPVLGRQDVRVRPIKGTSAGNEARGVWEKTSDGYWMVLIYETPQPLHRGDTFAVEVVVNQMEPGRVRRAGQLVLSGGGGWVYLRGDRESSENALRAVVK